MEDKGSHEYETVIFHQTKKLTVAEMTKPTISSGTYFLLLANADHSIV